jgi:amidophosphoribosyltransferase
MALRSAHNGNLTNTEELMSDLFAEDLRHINTSSDSEVLLNVLANELGMLRAIDPSPTEMFKAVGAVHQRCRGAYAVVAYGDWLGLAGFSRSLRYSPLGVR